MCLTFVKKLFSKQENSPLIDTSLELNDNNSIDVTQKTIELFR